MIRMPNHFGLTLALRSIGGVYLLDWIEPEAPAPPLDDWVTRALFFCARPGPRSLVVAMAEG